MGVVRLSFTMFIIAALAVLVSASAERSLRKKKGAKTKSFRLRRNPQPSRLTRSHSPTTSVEDEAWGAEASEARELNIFLRNSASLIFDDNVMSMSMPTMAPAVVRPVLGGITGNSEDALTLTTLSPTISDVKDNGSFETPEPIPLPTQPPVCTPLDSLPGNSDIVLNISVTYELTIESNASLSEVLESVEVSLQDILASSLAGCGTNDSRRLSKILDGHGRSLVITAINSLGVAEMSRADYECHTAPAESSGATCSVVDGGISIYFEPDTPEAVIGSHEEGLNALLEDTLNDPTFINDIPGVLGAEYIDMTGQFQSQASTEEPMAPNSEDARRLPIIGAVFLVAGTVFLGAILANRWKEKKSGGDLLRMQKLESYDSNTTTNDITATDVPYPPPDSTTLGFSTDDDQDAHDDDGENSIDTGIAAIRSVDLSDLPRYKGDSESIGDNSSCDFESADGSGHIVSLPCGLASQHMIADNTRSVSPYCYPSFQIWPNDEDSTI